MGGAQVWHTYLDTRQVLVVFEGGVIDETHLLLEARHIVMSDKVQRVVPQGEPSLPLEHAAAGQRHHVGVGQSCLQIGATNTWDQDYWVVDPAIISRIATTEEADEKGEEC